MQFLTHSNLKRRIALAGTIVALAALGVFATASAGANRAAAAPADGPIAILATVGDGPAGKIVVAGAIGDWGSSLTTDKNGKPDANGDYVKITLKKGGFVIDSAALNKATANPRPQVASDTTCSVSAGGTATVTLLDGTGLYQGISGTIRATMTFSGVGSRYRSGVHKGQCQHRGNPIAVLGTVIGHGTVHFS